MTNIHTCFKPNWKVIGLLVPGIAVLFVSFLLPLAWLVRMSLMPQTADGALATGLSIHAYSSILGDEFYWWEVWRTIELGLFVTLLAVPMSIPIALFLSRSHSSWRGTLTALAIAPLLTSTVVRTYGWMVILGRHGVINRTLIALGVLTHPIRLDNGTFATVVALVEILMPYAIVLMLSYFSRLNPELEDAAALLGADRWHVFVRVTLPLILPGILTASMLVFTLTISSLVTPQLMGGGRVFVLATEIFAQTTISLNWPIAGALSILLLTLLGFVISIYQRLIIKLEHSS